MSMPPPEPSEQDVLAFLETQALDALELPADTVQRLNLETPLVEGLSLDSLRQVVLVTAIEEHFGFEFEAEELTELGAGGTLGDLVLVIQRRAGATEVDR